MTWLGSERWGRVHHDMAWFRKVGVGGGVYHGIAWFRKVGGGSGMTMAWFRKGGGGEVNTGDVLVQKRGGGAR